MSKMLYEAIEDYLKNMRLNINFFISFLDKNLYKNEEVKSYTSSLISLIQSSNSESYLIAKFP